MKIKMVPKEAIETAHSGHEKIVYFWRRFAPKNSPGNLNLHHNLDIDLIICYISIIYIIIMPKKFQRGIFPRHEAYANLLGELTRPTAEGEATIEVRTSPPGQECKPTRLTRRAPSGDPPGGDRLTHWQMCLPTLHQ